MMSKSCFSDMKLCLTQNLKSVEQNKKEFTSKTLKQEKLFKRGGIFKSQTKKT